MLFHLIFCCCCCDFGCKSEINCRKPLMRHTVSLLKTLLEEGEIAQGVNTTKLGHQAWQSKFNPQGVHGGGREPIPTGFPLICKWTCTHACMCMYVIKIYLMKDDQNCSVFPIFVQITIKSVLYQLWETLEPSEFSGVPATWRQRVVLNGTHQRQRPSSPANVEGRWSVVWFSRNSCHFSPLGTPFP